MAEAWKVPGEIASALARGATVLTGNQRAARTLRRAVERSSRAAGQLANPVPAIFSWDAWTASLWHRLLLEGGTGHMLLNRSQEAAIWRALIEEDEGVSSLRSPDALAAMAAETWGLLARYRGLGRLRGSGTGSDSETLIRLATAFEERCRDKGYLPQARLDGVLRRTVLDGGLALPAASGLHLVGFDRVTPSQRALLDALRDTGLSLGMASSPPGAEHRARFAAEDEASELHAAAHWIRSFLERNAGATIAVLVPGLNRLRAQIDRVFREVLAPEAQPVASPVSALPFEFSTGVPLAETSMVAVVLDLLAWPTEPMPLQNLSHLLLSPHLGGGVELSARAEFDAFELRRAMLLRPETTLDWLVAKITRSPRRNRLDTLLTALRAMQTVARRRFAPQERRPYGEWAEAIREFLAAAGWAARAATDSVEFQTREKWESALDELATLDFDGRRVPFGNALTTLRGIAHDTTFAPESRHAPIQIMPPEESAGTRFNAVWFLGANDLAWPAPVPHSPLLGWPLRRELGLPGSDPAADFAQAKRVTERILASAGTAIFSYARETADGRQRPSPLLGMLDLEERHLDAPTRQSEPLVETEAVDEQARIPLPRDPHVRGGARVLQAQAACAFHAFAEYRLFAGELDLRDPGMTPGERGVAVHHVLERFWEEVKTQAALKQMTSDAREDLLLRCVEEALTNAEAQSATSWDAAYLDTQRGRLVALSGAWLELEAARALPFTVVGREIEARDIALGPIHLNLRIDRIDQTEQGAVLIDYKTGAASPSAWEGERPDEPQLPLYAVLADDLPLHAVAFGTVRPGKEMKLTGYAEAVGTLTASPRFHPISLEPQVEAWRNVLTQLATDFWNGDTRVSPKMYPGTCKHCAHRLICRLDAPSLDLDEEPEEESPFDNASGDEFG